MWEELDMEPEQYDNEVHHFDILKDSRDSIGDSRNSRNSNGSSGHTTCDDNSSSSSACYANNSNSSTGGNSPFWLGQLSPSTSPKDKSESGMVARVGE